RFDGSATQYLQQECNIRKPGDYTSSVGIRCSRTVRYYLRENQYHLSNRIILRNQRSISADQGVGHVERRNLGIERHVFEHRSKRRLPRYHRSDRQQWNSRDKPATLLSLRHMAADDSGCPV